MLTTQNTSQEKDGWIVVPSKQRTKKSELNTTTQLNMGPNRMMLKRNTAGTTSERHIDGSTAQMESHGDSMRR